MDVMSPSVRFSIHFAVLMFVTVCRYLILCKHKADFHSLHMTSHAFSTHRIDIVILIRRNLVELLKIPYVIESTNCRSGYDLLLTT